MTSGTPKLGGSQQPLRLAGLLTGLFVTILVVTIAAAFWREIRGLAWPWQVGVGALALWIVLKAFTAGRNPEKAQVEMADVVYRAGRYEEALVLVGKILSVCPTNSEAFYLKGQCLHRLDREEEAMAAWLESIKHNPAHCKAAHRLGCEQENRGDYLKAAEYFTIAREAGAMAEGPDTFQQNIESTKQALTQAGRRAEQTDAREAIKYIDAFVKLEPTHAIAHAWRGHKQFLLGDYDAAIRDAEVCLRLDPKYRKASELIQAAQAKLNAEAAREQLDVTGQVALRGPGSSGLPFTTTTPSSTEVTTRVKLEEGKPPTIGTDAATLWRPRDKAFDRYEVRKIVGGGFGTVYCAWDLKTNLPVALKAIRLDTVIDKATARQAFRREAQYWRSLGNHPHIVELLSVEKFQYRHLILVSCCCMGG